MKRILIIVMLVLANFVPMKAFGPAEAAAQTAIRKVYVTGYSQQTYGSSRYFQPSPYGGSITYSYSQTVSNSFSGNVGLSAGVISATVGFDVTKSTTVDFSRTLTMAPNRGLTVTPLFGWEVTTYDLYQGTRYLGRVTVRKLVYSDLRVQ